MFTGFSPETVDFLWGIRMNNNRDWFLAHKKQYVDSLYEPMKALGAAVFEPFLDSPGSILKVSRIYRDARLHHPLPYKESLWLCIRQDVDWWAENPCLFFEIRPEGVSYGYVPRQPVLTWAENPCLFFEIRPEGISYGFTVWKPKVATMDRFRRQIAAKPQDFQKLLRDTERKTGIPVTAECYKRPKEAPTQALAPYFAWKGDISCVRSEDVGPEIFGPQLETRVRQMLTDLIPLYDYFNQFTE